MKTTRRHLIGLLAFALCAGATLAQAGDGAVQHALAPSGALKVGVYRGSPSSIIEGPTPQDAKGVGYDLGKALAAALGVRFEPAIYPANAPLLKALAAGEVDVIFTNATAERAKQMDFSQHFMAVEKSFLVAAGSPLKTIADATRPRVKIGVSKGSSTAKELAKLYPAMSIAEVDTLKHAGEMLAAHQIDAFATNNAILYELSDRVPGSRVLPGHWGMEHFGAAIPKGRDSGMPYLRDFMTKALSDGTVAKAIARAGLRGTVPDTGKD
jgi:polar amino acid transport system substrate-binding protein